MSRRHPVLTEGQLRSVASLFAVLADPNRLMILQRLRSGACSVSTLVNELDLKQANVSKHLGVLHRAGILGRDTQGTSVIYNIKDKRVFELCRIVCDQIRNHTEEQASIFKG